MSQPGREGHVIFLTAPRDDFETTATDAEKSLIGRHFAHLKRHFEAGDILLAGPTMGAPPIGLVIVPGGDAEAARRIMEGDPAVVEGLFKAELRPMSLSLLREPGIDTSLHDAEATDRQIVVERTVAATPAECWAKWTTEGGIASFLTPASNIELRIGGPFEIYFLPDAPAGERGSDGCHILSFLPQRMLSFEWNAPPQFAAVRQRRSRVVILFDEVEGGTRVQLTHLGFGAGDEWDQVHTYFSRAWPHVMDAFAQSFEK